MCGIQRALDALCVKAETASPKALWSRERYLGRLIQWRAFPGLEDPLKSPRDQALG